MRYGNAVLSEGLLEIRLRPISPPRCCYLARAWLRVELHSQHPGPGPGRPTPSHVQLQVAWSSHRPGMPLRTQNTMAVELEITLKWKMPWLGFGLVSEMFFKVLGKMCIHIVCNSGSGLGFVL